MALRVEAVHWMGAQHMGACELWVDLEVRNREQGQRLLWRILYLTAGCGEKNGAFKGPFWGDSPV